MHKKGISLNSVEKSLSHSADKNCGRTLLGFQRILVSKFFKQRRGKLHGFVKCFFISQDRKKFATEPFCVSEIFKKDFLEVLKNLISSSLEYLIFSGATTMKSVSFFSSFGHLSNTTTAKTAAEGFRKEGFFWHYNELIQKQEIKLISQQLTLFNNFQKTKV